MKILITGGAGFIGSALVRHILDNTDHQVLNIDSLTYAGNLESLGTASKNSRYQFLKADIADGSAMTQAFSKFQPEAVMHLAAESHVDRSISSPSDFIQTNIVGTYTLLEVARAFWCELDEQGQKRFRFHHISTDEVYGDLEGVQALFTEQTPYAPSSPYSASKASSDHLVRAWHRTFGLPIVITNCSNNYGCYQFPEKLIPLVILNAIEGKPLPVYGDGGQIRDWLHVEDHVRALMLVLTEGRIGETYNIGGCNEKTNLDVVNSICDLLQQLVPDTSPVGGAYKDLITFVKDRPGHDRRYAIDASKMERELNWVPQETFETGLRKTVAWYLENSDWVNHIRAGEYR